MSRKKIIVEGVGSVILSNQTGYKDLLNTEGVKCLLDSGRNRVGDFATLVDGGNYTLGPLQQKQPDCIFSHGLPKLGPLSESTKFTTNPSVPTEDQHAAASLQISTFAALSDLEESKLPYPKTNMWNQLVGESGTLGGYSSEADVNSHVKKVFVDILESLGIREKVTIREEVEVMRNRPDFMLIFVNGHPIGSIEGKQPGKDAMEHKNILGEVYDQLMHLRSIFRVNTPFAILTCYNQAMANLLVERPEKPRARWNG